MLTSFNLSEMIPPSPYIDDAMEIRVRQRMREEAIKAIDLAKAVGMSRSWVAGEFLAQPARVLRRLIINEPEKAQTLARALKYRDLTAMVNDLDLSEAVAPLIASQTLETYPLDEDPRFVSAPVYSFVSASLDGTVGDDLRIVDRRRILKSKMQNGYELFRVVGDSMNPSIKDGDDIRVDTHNTKPSDGDVYLIAIPHGQVCVKRLQQLEGEWWMFSDNADRRQYPPQRFPENAVIRGHVESKFPAEQPIPGI